MYYWIITSRGLVVVITFIVHTVQFIGQIKITSSSPN